MMKPDSKIVVAGGTGLVGSALIRNLLRRGYTNVVATRHSRPPLGDARVRYVPVDLTRQDETERFMEDERPEYLFLAAAKVGGIQANATYRADFIYQNIAIAANVLNASYRYGVRKLLNLGSSCIYPKLSPQPMKEEYLLTGPLEDTNEPYAVAKIAAIKMCGAYNAQYGTNFISAMPTNLYGPGDNFDLVDSHVLPAMVRKIHLAKCLMQGDFAAIVRDFTIFGNREANTKGRAVVTGQESSEEEIRALLDSFGIRSQGTAEVSVWLWGTGSPRREFLHSDDCADAVVFLMENHDWRDIGEHINIGTGEDMTIADLALLIKKAVDFKGKICFDSEHPDGTPRKLLDVSRIRELGWRASTDIGAGIRGVYEWYLRQAASAG